MYVRVEQLEQIAEETFVADETFDANKRRLERRTRGR